MKKIIRETIHSINGKTYKETYCQDDTMFQGTALEVYVKEEDGKWKAINTEDYSSLVRHNSSEIANKNNLFFI